MMKRYLLVLAIAAGLAKAERGYVTTVKTVMTSGNNVILYVAATNSCSYGDQGRTRTPDGADARFLNNVAAIAMQAKATGEPVTIFVEDGNECTGHGGQQKIMGIALGTGATW